MTMNAAFIEVAKRVLPRSAQIALRQRRARRLLESVRDEWPIRDDACRAPEGWPGWPSGRRFALVLTHDVDTLRGLDRCPALAELEQRRGVRSAYYFVPEGRYALPPRLRQELSAGGAEIGVHGLVHDWRTFLDRRTFERRAERIDRYLRDWGAEGFRAPSTVRNLDWIGELAIGYDSSGFDTDPFEPQPEGSGTIFPFWVRSRTSGRRYVELPYTLPQDHAVFVTLREPGIDTWKRKLDWIAAAGGMALLIVHPDYMAFDGAPGPEEYPAAWYDELLAYVAERYPGQAWNATPREAAAYFRSVLPDAPERSRRRVAMAAYAFYDSDNRIIRYAETLARRGDEVEVIALRRPGQPRTGFRNGVRILRIQQRERNERKTLAYLARLTAFLLRSSWTLGTRSLARRYDVVHVHSVPDFEVFAAWLPKAQGSGVILDIHDILPEFFASKFAVATTHPLVRMLRVVERVSCRFAHHVIVANHLWRDRLVARSAPVDRCSVVLNHVDYRFLEPRPRAGGEDRFRIVYPGGLQWHQGLDLAIEAFARLRVRVPAADFHIYGEGSERQRLEGVVARLGLERAVLFHPPVPFAEIPDLMATADLGVVAKRADSFGNEAFSTKILEYMSQGVPVICARTAIDRFYFPEDTVRFFASGSVDELAEAMIELASRPEERARLARRGRAYIARENWTVHQGEYLDLVDRLAERRTTMMEGWTPCGSTAQ